MTAGPSPAGGTAGAALHASAAVPPVPRLAVYGLSKTFGGVRALDDVSLVVMPGEIHGLVGQNGSGKSTLIKVLAGFHAPDDASASIAIDAEEMTFPLQPAAVRAAGLRFVHQDLALVPSLSVLENLRVDEIAASRHRWRIPWRRERARARQTFAQYGLELSPHTLVEQLPPIDRARLAIVRAVERVGVRGDASESGASGSGVLILDEPTAFLPQGESEHLFALMREIAGSGASVVFVSHDIDEVRSVTNSVTVLRDGRTCGTGASASISEAQLIEMIIGRPFRAIAERDRAAPATARETAVSVRSLRGRYVADLSMEIGRGEIVGLTGVVGSGFDEVPALLFGATPARGGVLQVGDEVQDVARATPSGGAKLGTALVPADRQNDGSVGSLTVADNVMLQVLGRFRGPFGLRRRKMVRECEAVLEQVEIRPNRPTMLYQALSGGNQQKALLAKWLQTQPRLLLLQEPTQGVDVGARQQIFSLLRDAARGGLPILCASSDHEQLAAICDRVFVFADGHVVSELDGEDITKDELTRHSIAMRAT